MPRVEVPRFILHFAGQKFDDIRMNFEEFDQMKSGLSAAAAASTRLRVLETPSGQLPLLFVDGHQISQSGAIARFLARRFKLDGADEFERARADEGEPRRAESRVGQLICSIQFHVRVAEAHKPGHKRSNPLGTTP